MKWILRNAFYLIVSAVVIAFFIAEWNSGRFLLHDFEVYYSAAKAYLNGQQIYGKAFGLNSGFFKYAPLSLYLFIPLALLPFTVAKIVFYFLVVGAILGCFRLCSSLLSACFMPEKGKVKFMTLLLTFILAGPHLFRELELGNVNIMLLLLFCSALLLLRKGKDLLAGIIIAAGVLIKLHFVILIPLLLFRKKYKTVLVFFLALFAGGLFPLLLSGYTKGLVLNRQWIQAVMEHNRSLLSFPDTIYSILYRYLIRFVYPEAGVGFIVSVLICVGVAFLILLLQHFKQEARTEGVTDQALLREKNFAFEYFFLLALIPNILATDTEHFLYAIPLILFSVQRFLISEKRMIFVLFFILMAFTYSDPGNDVLGKGLSDWLELHGFTGIGNVLLLISSLILFSRLNKQGAVSPSKP
jgi:hypothetical protein